MILSQIWEKLGFPTRYAGATGGVSPTQPGRLRRITFFYEDPAEYQTVEPIAQVARERGYDISFSEDLLEPAEVGVFSSHHPDASNACLSVFVPHDLGEEQWPESPSHEPNYWRVSPWDRLDICVLPGRAWSECWHSVSWQASARPRLGAFELGWPKADRVFRDPQAFWEEVEQLRGSLGLKVRPSVLYAPSWECDTKQDDFVQALVDLPVNLLIKQADWPDEIARIQEVTEKHRKLASNIYLIDPKVNIMNCLAMADVLVSDESNCLAEALLFDVPGISVSDWPIPALGGWPPRFSEPPSFALTTARLGLRSAVEGALRDQAELRLRVRRHRDHYFSHLGRSSAMIMDVLESALNGSPWPVPPLVALDAAGPAKDQPVVEEEAAPTIDEFGPAWIKAGVPFNVQPSGRSALWFRTEHVRYPTVVVFGGRELRTVVAPDGHTVTATVPNELFRVPGEYEVFLLDRRRQQTSEVVKLRVE